MARALGIVGLALLIGCGVDAPPVPPGQENPETIQSIDEIDPSAYF